MENKIIYREVQNSDSTQFYNLLNEITEDLKAKGKSEFFIPPQTFFDNLFDENYVHNIGAFSGKKMVGIVSLCFNQENVQNYKEKIGIMDKKVCELGNALILPEYRGKGIIQILNQMIIDLAKKLKYEVAVATVHPDNISSKKALEKELILVGETAIQGHPRLLFRKDLL